MCRGVPVYRVQANAKPSSPPAPCILPQVQNSVYSLVCNYLFRRRLNGICGAKT
jgi:hypothetical protein